MAKQPQGIISHNDPVFTWAEAAVILWMHKHNRVVKRTEIVEALYGTNDETTRGAVRMMIFKTNQKLKENGFGKIKIVDEKGFSQRNSKFLQLQLDGVPKLNEYGVLEIVDAE